MVINRPDAFFARLATDAKIGFGEAYMVGDWDTGPGTDLADLLTPLASNVATMVPEPLQRFRRLIERRQPTGEQGTPSQARQNIHRHYDLSNDLFASFLDETLSYSSAMFGEALFGDGDDLAAAQRRKIDAILNLASVGPGCEMLEIGTGWGELAIRAAQRGAHVTTVTLSTEQRDLALRRVAAAGVSGRVRVLVADYREVVGQYDAIVSVEMVEAVGRRFWRDYFATLDRLLRPGGRIGLQSITISHDRLLTTQDSYTWIHKYIFPGGLVPSIEAIDSTLQAHTSLTIAERRDFGPDYATTLKCWRDSFVDELADDRGRPVRRRLQADVGVLPRLLRSRVSRPLPRRQPVRPRQIVIGRQNVSWPRSTLSPEWGFQTTDTVTSRQNATRTPGEWALLTSVALSEKATTTPTTAVAVTHLLTRRERRLATAPPSQQPPERRSSRSSAKPATIDGDAPYR